MPIFCNCANFNRLLYTSNHRSVIHLLYALANQHYISCLHDLLLPVVRVYWKKQAH